MTIYWFKLHLRICHWLITSQFPHHLHK